MERDGGEATALLTPAPTCREEAALTILLAATAWTLAAVGPGLLALRTSAIEINEDGPAGAIDHGVRGLDVSVKHPQRAVHIVQRTGQIVAETQHQLLGQKCAAGTVHHVAQASLLRQRQNQSIARRILPRM